LFSGHVRLDPDVAVLRRQLAAPRKLRVVQLGAKRGVIA
jgi:hypothetical protein